MSDTTDGYGLVPAGWHPDPKGVAAQRYWNGQSWTTHVVDQWGNQYDELATRAEVQLPVAQQWAQSQGQGLAPNHQTHFAHQSVHHSTVVVTAPKSRGVAFLLTFFFGPLGMLYSTVAGGIVMFLISIVLIPLTFGLATLVLWPISILWGVLACPSSVATSIQTSHTSETGFGY